MNRQLPDDQLDAALARFGESVRGWSEENTVLPGPMASWKAPRRNLWRVSWILATAVTAILLIGIQTYLHLTRQRAAERASEDAALLKQIDSEISRAVPGPMEPLVKLVSWGAGSTTSNIHKESR